ncbi:MAG: branched-chain amino acid transport system II carrier protein [Alphaproteobacteria bacterium]|nr:branched-chain amino acid transport system II carrier protein [Alphaproteobacteria bacterium]
MNGLKFNFKKCLSVMTGSFAIFAMFFGAGNLVFPILAGKATHNAFFPAFLGLTLTGVLVPLLGLIGILLYNGNYQDFFDRFGKKPAFILIALMLLLMGPFGALPRCITVAYGSFAVLSSSLSLICFSLIISFIVFILCLNQNQIVPLLGAFLAPAKIVSVGFIILFGLLFASSPHPSLLPTSEAFEYGALKGYQMMDLIASFFFATIIAAYFKNKFTHNDEHSGTSFNLTLYSILLGSSLLMIVYLVLVYLGATFSEALSHNPPEQFLSMIAHLTLGPSGGHIVTVAIILSCLTTIIALTTVFTDFLHEHIFRARLNRLVCLSITILTSFLMSNLGFSEIAALLSPILFYLYPLLILLTFINIGTWIWRKHGTMKNSILS